MQCCKDWMRFPIRIRSFSRSWKIMYLKLETIMKSFCHREILKWPYQTRVMDEKWAHYLKRKFQKDEQYFSHYKNFMNVIIEKGYMQEYQIEHQLMASQPMFAVKWRCLSAIAILHWTFCIEQLSYSSLCFPQEAN